MQAKSLTNPENHRYRFAEEGYLSGLTLCNPSEAQALYSEFLGAEREIEARYTDAEILDPRRTIPEQGWFVLTHQDWRDEAHPFQELVRSVVSSPNLLLPLQEILGDNILLRNVDFISKEVGKGTSPLGWHTDTHHPYERSQGFLSAWIALTDANIENGAMSLIRKSHRHHFQNEPSPDKHLHITAQSLAELDTFERVPCILSAGQFSLHHARTVHASNANRSDGRRLGMVLRLFNAECPADVADTREAMIISGYPKTWKRQLRSTVPMRWHKRD